MTRVMLTPRGTPLDRALEARRCRGRTSKRFRFEDGTWRHVHGEPGDWLVMGIAADCEMAEYWFVTDEEMRKRRCLCWDLEPLGTRDGYEDDAPAYPYPNRGGPLRRYQIDLRVVHVFGRAMHHAVVTRGGFTVATCAHACPRTAVRRARYAAMERVRFSATT